jgi:CubicO group peptidase (beta-lactamase class C family)
VVVIHRGKLLAEQYAPGFGPDSRLAGWSLTKTVTNALVGILVKEGKLDLHVPAPIPTWKNQEAFISLDHILRMNTGLDLPENYKGYTRVLRMLFLEPNVAEFAAKAPQKVPPGTFFDYSSPTTNLLATLMRQCFPTLEAYLAFPYTALFHPLGMGSALMETDSAGNYIHSSFMHATARDWARIGQLFLQKGQWQGRQILPENWVDYSLTPTDGASAGQYGAHIWRNAWQEVPGEKRFFPQVPSDMFYASGFEEQKIGVIPSQSLVVVRLGLTYPPRTWNFGDFLQPFVEAVSPQT